MTEAVLNALFLRGRKTGENQLQLDLGLEAPQVASLHARWELDSERERHQPHPLRSTRLEA